MKLYTISEIAEILNINTRTVLYRFERLGIRGERKSNRDYFTKEQIDMISVEKNKIPYMPFLSNPKHYNRQVTIVEEWMRQKKKNARKISKEFKFPMSYTDRTIKLFLNRECIIIQSKINKK